MKQKNNHTITVWNRPKKNAKGKRFSAFAFGIFLIVVLSACDRKGDSAKPTKQNTGETEIEASLVFNNVTLDQADEKGNPLWEIKAEKATYSQDKKTAIVENPTGDLFQDGKVVLQVSAKQGEIQQDGQIVFLRGQIIAKDLRNGTQLRGEELEWHPQEDLLVVRNNLKGEHPQLQASAKEGRYFSRKQQLELTGQVAAISKDPNLHMKTEHLVWLIQDQKVLGDQRIHMERYKDQKVTDTVEADKSELNQKTKVVTLQQNVQLKSVDPPLLMSSNSAVWNLNTQTVISDQPLQIVQQKENLTLTANQGQIDLEREVADLTGGVQGIASRNQAKLYSNQLRWNIPTQLMQASGNVIYQQVDPPLNTTGVTAEGKLQDQSIVVKGGAGTRVVTEIIPKDSPIKIP
ncbi:LPS export ABC transporter periplasmic protein LptC [Lyngbya aestuarii]|uniref:LPS export ABC transporter periplasmic protein LptC n=1 Tax=Lyngbya aestuarii TaxID=118322 RepID=UPI00403DD917